MSTFLGPIQLRVDTTANWASYNPVMGLGEIGVDQDLKRIKIGDGANGFLQLPWVNNDQGTVNAILAAADQVDGAVEAATTATAAASAAVAAKTDAEAAADRAESVPGLFVPMTRAELEAKYAAEGEAAVGFYLLSSS